ncbi:RGD1566118 (predicted), isoform CRA_a [Rattus norvegicus]|uniref:RGD1566118 (Predicted), isoform CRA_a n=1 Tax=Rattus norvegicus TaxID=10116 RepID=A6KTP0_RAT|nr:RGD1566118 (predicted), isoform CRA_a [Rattus norvegicus]EDL83471.1 RGD1566118 (predicted), isoform CRA_a [Rattus norvegicus]
MASFSSPLCCSPPISAESMDSGGQDAGRPSAAGS